MNKERRCKVLRIDRHDIIDLFVSPSRKRITNLPEGCVVSHAWWDNISESLSVALYHSSFDEVLPGYELPWFLAQVEVANDLSSFHRTTLVNEILRRDEEALANAS